MKVTFYRVGSILDSLYSTYLGNLIEVETKEVNVDVGNISQINLLLPKECSQYNYIKVEIDARNNYYYMLETWNYYNGVMLKFKYNIDVIRTLKEKNALGHLANIGRYTNVLPMTESQTTYFWKNQGNKLGANVIDDFTGLQVNYSDDSVVQELWSQVKWVYLWLQPRLPEIKSLPAGQQLRYNYKFKKTVVESPIGDLRHYRGHPHLFSLGADSGPGGSVRGKYGWTFANANDWFAYEENPFFSEFQVGALYVDSFDGSYYRFVETNKLLYVRTNTGDFIWQLFPVRQLASEANFSQAETDYYLNFGRTYTQDSPNNLYCVVLPLGRNVEVHRMDGQEIHQKLSWNSNNLLNHLLDVNSENTWLDYIVDMKVSLLPPFNNSDNVEFRRTGASTPLIVFKDNFSPLSDSTLRTVDPSTDTLVDNTIFLPSLRYKPDEVVELKTNFKLPELSKETMIFKKYMLATVEERVELDLPLLKVDGANTLYFYDDIGPGRNNTIVGYAPSSMDVKGRVYYLLHSPSALVMSRDTSLPTFTPYYQTYLANNKNFMQQAELQRKTELTQALIQNGASFVGAAAVGMTTGGYNPAAAMIKSVAGGINAGIAHNAQKKNFMWGVENMKSAPGNYKSANSTLSLMLGLGVFEYWMETFDTNEFDKQVFNTLLDDVGYEYMEFEYRVDEVIGDSLVTPGKKFLQGIITGITYMEDVDAALLNILRAKLESGVNIYTEVK